MEGQILDVQDLNFKIVIQSKYFSINFTHKFTLILSTERALASDETLRLDEAISVSGLIELVITIEAKINGGESR